MGNRKRKVLENSHLSLKNVEILQLQSNFRMTKKVILRAKPKDLLKFIAIFQTVS